MSDEQPGAGGRPSPEEEALWRARFGKFALLRIVGLVLILGGIIVGLTNLAAPGGLRVAGGILAITGVIVGMIVPRRLRRSWDE